MDGLESLARFEQLCSLRGEIGHLAREDIALAVERIERAAQIVGVVAGRLELASESLLLGQAVRQRPVPGADLLKEALPLVVGAFDRLPGVLKREQRLIPFAFEGRQLALQLGEKLRPR